MNQSTIIAGAIVLGYIVFIALRGELPCYLKILGIGSGSSICPANNPASTAAQYLTPSGVTTGSIGGTGVGVGIGGSGGCVQIGVKVPGSTGSGVGVSFPLPVFCGGGGGGGGGGGTPPVIGPGGGGGGL